jgi:hypothetical protein
MTAILPTRISEKRFAAVKQLLDNILPFMLLLLAFIILFQFAFPVTEQLQQYLTLANWGVMAYFAVRLAVDYRLSGPDDNFWQNHWMDVLMVVPLFSAAREARLARAAEETVVASDAGEQLLATSAIRNSRAAAKVTRILRIIKRSF